LLLPVDRFDRIPELTPAPSFDFDERHRSLALHDEIDVSMAVPEAALNHTPSVSPKPALRYPLSELSERVAGR
jgi:hypothetical protein